MTNGKKTTLLCILDGFGLNPDKKGNAIAHARKPVFDKLFGSVPTTVLTTHGERVGLPAGQMGNSEVGHLNIGAGRVIEQWLVRISRELEDGSVENNDEFKAFARKVANLPRIHLVGLFSEGGVHSHLEHLKSTIEKLEPLTSGSLCLHLITDGRDVSPHQAVKDVAALLPFLAKHPRVKIATVVGRFFAMDRDKRWERSEKAFNAMVNGTGTPVTEILAALQASYNNDVTDEFIEPMIMSNERICPGDAVLFWNFREDRMRQIVDCLASKHFTHFPRGAYDPSNSAFLCFTEYDHNFHLPALFNPLEIKNHLGEVVSNLGMTQLRVAETEKYPHVTYFLNGGIEKEYANEARSLVASPRDVKTYDLKPEMSAAGVCAAVIEGIKARAYDLIVVNFANCDMVGHTGVMEAAVRAVEMVDSCLGKILNELSAAGGQAMIIADHGNADQLIDYNTGMPFTQHTTFPVPCMLVGLQSSPKLRLDGALCDVAPTILKMMGIAQPKEMTGKPLY